MEAKFPWSWGAAQATNEPRRWRYADCLSGAAQLDESEEPFALWEDPCRSVSFDSYSVRDRAFSH
jgi:hypothetical protein